MNDKSENKKRLKELHKSNFGMSINEAKTKAYPDGGGRYLIEGKFMHVHCDEYHMHSFNCLVPDEIH